MSLIGYIEQFNPAKSDITSYIERLEQLFICNVVDKDKEVPLLISLIGGETYSVLKDLLASEVQSSKTFEELKRVLIEHYCPKRDRFVCGVRSVQIRRKLLAEDNISFERAYEIALSIELTEGQVRSMEQENVAAIEGKLDKVMFRKREATVKKDDGHQTGRTKAWQCFSCKKVGHTSAVCRSKVSLLEEDDIQDEIEEENSLFLGFLSSLEPENSAPEKIVLEVEESKHNFTPLLGRNWLNVLHPNWRQIVNCSHNEFVSQLELENLETSSLISQLKREFKSDFDENNNSFIKGFEIDLKLKENTQPIFHRAYDMPFALKDKVELEIKKLVELGILEKVSYSNWASPIVVVPKKLSEELRICVDFKKTLNKVLDSDHCALPLPENIFACLSRHKYFTVLDLKDTVVTNIHYGWIRKPTAFHHLTSLSTPSLFHSVSYSAAGLIYSLRA
ncbi:uncharacterized protein [Diabrotica undecimpunctata]|uniref:uncharacterized protein n=1 Tax=Diabrotica undecimpunctata TaxID=50387 RepID=UPI003B63B671